MTEIKDTRARAGIHRLWDELPSFGAYRSMDALLFCMNTLAELIRAQHAYWIGTLRLPELAAPELAPKDPLDGWRVRAFHFGEPPRGHEAISRQHLRGMDGGEIDASIIANLSGAGTYRVNVLSDMMPPNWFKSKFFQRFYASMGCRDAIFVMTPVSGGIESWLAFERFGDQTVPFGETERALLAHAMRPLKWFHRQLVLHYGVALADQHMTAAEQRVLAELLTAKTEQQIAEKLSLSPTTVHSYCTRLYRKFGVHSRPGLTALWLGRVREIDDT
ncbi:MULTISPECIES: response regulator transcription factor [Thiorhodovibrio]|uniref:response regulator transcription factor n=1 Tax=Thiorhodovibrio TaxID=61593 RepID=UPI001913E850|nr:MULTISPECIES: LuxR C-terminal-related transcriptional regulator [Thiorhodovibrio]WPL11228.1 ATP-dependent transcriptional regulator [Thiorhodovibrio litoralis]